MCQSPDRALLVAETRFPLVEVEENRLVLLHFSRRRHMIQISIGHVTSLSLNRLQVPEVRQRRVSSRIK